MTLLDLILALHEAPHEANDHPVVVLGAGETEWEIRHVEVEDGQVRLSVEAV